MSDARPGEGIQAGAVLGGSYRLVHRLGVGGMGTVWLAEHMRLTGRSVAIKILLPDAASDADALARFQREAEVTSRLGHPNVVEVHDFDRLPDGTPYLVLEHLDGESLSARLRRGAVGFEEAAQVVRQIGSALRAAHRAGVVHRDLKPANIFLCPEEDGAPPRAVVLDFGISKIRGSTTLNTASAVMIGTPQYMAPEQARGEHDRVDPRTDVFALGALTYEMLAGRPPFAGDTLHEVVFRVVYEPAPPLVVDAPAAAIAAIGRALEKDLRRRLPSAAAFVAAFTGRPLPEAAGDVDEPTDPALAAGLTPAALADAAAVAAAGRPRKTAPTLIVGSGGPGVGSAGTASPSAVTVAGSGPRRLSTPPPIAGSGPRRLSTPPPIAEAAAAEAAAPVSVPAERRPLVQVAALVLAAALGVALFLLLRGPGHDARGSGVAHVPAVESTRPVERPVVVLPPTEVVVVLPPTEVVVPPTEPTRDGQPANPADAGPPARLDPGPPRGGVERTETGKRKPPAPPVADVAAEPRSDRAAQDLAAARSAYASGNFDVAIRIAARSYREAPSSAALVLRARAYCQLSDLGNARAAYANLPHHRQAAVARLCRKRGIDLGD